MSLKSQIETAKDAISKALITALESKDEFAISSLFDCYNKLNTIKTKESYKFELRNGISTNKYETYNIPSSMNDDVISFSSLG